MATLYRARVIATYNLHLLGKKHRSSVVFATDTTYIADDIQPRKNTQPVSGGRVMGVANFTLMIWKKS